MTDTSLPSPADQVTPLLTESQIDNAVATRILTEVHTGLTESDRYKGSFYLQQASDDMHDLAGDPSKTGVVQTVADKIESSDPTLGAVTGTVEKDKKGNITGFTFTYAQTESVYNEKLNADMMQGNTLSEAQAIETYNLSTYDIAYKQGVMHLDATDVSK